jgi:hypothetical protein
MLTARLMVTELEILSIDTVLLLTYIATFLPKLERAVDSVSLMEGEMNTVVISSYVVRSTAELSI